MKNNMHITKTSRWSYWQKYLNPSPLNFSVVCKAKEINKVINKISEFYECEKTLQKEYRTCQEDC